MKLRFRPNILMAMGIGAVLTLSSVSGAAEKKATTAEKKAPRTTPAPPQPKLVALPVTKCIECKSTVRKRVAVMPVKIGTLAAELQMPADAVATKVRDLLESKVSERPSFLAVSRSELGDVIAEQKLTDSAAFNQELLAPRGRLIPAQLLIVATVDRLDMAVDTRQESSSTAESYIKKAVSLEGQARVAQDEARTIADNIDERAAEKADSAGMMTESAGGLGCALGGLLSRCRDMDCFNRQQQAQQDCQEKARREGERARQQAIANERRNIQSEVNDKRAQARDLLTEAANLRRQADVEARKDVSETKTTTARLIVTWKAVDASTSAVLGSGTSEATGSSSETGVRRETAFASTRATASSRSDILVNEVIGGAIQKVAVEIDAKLESIPFRTKIVKVDNAGITINCGKNLGLAAGDTFGVREKREVLTDPDTGLPLEKPGPPVGVIRVTEVFEKTAFAQLVEKAAAPLRRGDDLEWIGMYALVNP